MSFLISSAQAATDVPTGQAAGTPWPLLVTMAAVFIVMYFMSIRPQQKKQKQVQDMLQSLAKGDEVVFAGGLLGRVTKLSDEFLIIEVATGLELRVQRQSIQATLPKGTLKTV
ncbi:MAG: preprotein translocase subunit YajC [Pseudomonadales bacterium]|nr:preprotein translocase subunit YajC [Pseudomonadales bacterium]